MGSSDHRCGSLDFSCREIDRLLENIELFLLAVAQLDTPRQAIIRYTLVKDPL